MATYLHPGVYVEEIPSGSKPIEAVGTSTALFIGYCLKGPVDTPKLINGWGDYERVFGGLQDMSDDDELHAGGGKWLGDPMGHAVYAFFQNGGGKAYVARLAAAAGGTLAEGELTQDGDVLLRVQARRPGSEGNKLRVRLKRASSASDNETYRIEVGYEDGSVFNLQEQWDDVSLSLDSDRFLLDVLNDPTGGSRRIWAWMPDLRASTREALRSLLNSAEETTIELAGASEGGGDETPLATATATLGDSSDTWLTFSAANPGSWGNRLVVRVTPEDDADDNASYRVDVGEGFGEHFDVQETYESVVLDAASLNFIEAVINGASPRLSAKMEATAPDEISALRSRLNGTEATFVALGGGTDGTWPGATDYQKAFTALRRYRDINMILLPGCWWDGSTGQDCISEAIAHANYMRNCMVIYDPPPNDELENAQEVAGKGFNTSTYAALYYPWVWVNNPFYDPDRAPGKPHRVLVSPAAFAAGLWARIDGKRGVWKAPAGVEATLLGATDLEYVVENDEQDYLNPAGVNAFRRLPGYGTVIWGSRTLATRADPEWRYVPVRRTAIFIEESLYNGIKWAVFEPNDHRLWSALRTNIESFMNGLFRSGAFQGEKASDAYFVRCGLGSTMTQGDIDAGRVIVEVGFAPLKPAEFVIVRIQQKVGQQ